MLVWITYESVWTLVWVDELIITYLKYTNNVYDGVWLAEKKNSLPDIAWPLAMLRCIKKSLNISKIVV